MEYNTETKPTVLGSYLNTDVLEEAEQRILVKRDNLTSMTATSITKNQSIPELRNSLVPLALSLKLGKSSVISTDPHPSFKNLKDDPYLKNQLTSPST